MLGPKLPASHSHATWSWSKFDGLIWFAGVLELVGGALLALGLLTRPVAFVLSGQMAVAYFIAHAPQSSPRWS